MATMEVRAFLRANDGVNFPKGGTAEAAAVDLQTPEAFVLAPGERRIVDTGLIAKAPRDHCFFILSRSGLAAKHGVFVLNSPGLIDRDYCGPNDFIKVILQNLGSEPVNFNAGDRIAQLMLVPTTTIVWKSEDSPEFSKVDSRGGLGSTGKQALS